MAFLRCTRIPVAILMLMSAPGWVSSQTTGGVVAGKGPVVQKGKVVVMAVADGKERGGDVAGGSGGLVRSAVRDALVARGFAPFSSDSASMADAIKEATALAYQD